MKGKGTIFDIGTIAELKFDATIIFINDLIDQNLILKLDKDEGVFYEAILE